MGKLRALLRKPHGYSDLLSALEDRELYFKESKKINDDRLVDELAAYIRQKYRKDYYGRSNTPSGVAETKARQILGLSDIQPNSGIERQYRPRNLADKQPVERFAEVIDAIKYGRISQIKLNFPWHPEIFWDENLPTTFPFQHTSAILYSGQAKQIFFSEDGKKYLFDRYDIPRNPRSVFVQGGLRGGDHYDRGGNKSAVYMSSLSIAQGYPMDDEGKDEGIYRESPVLEVNVPTERLEIHLGGDGNNMKTLQDMVDAYSTPDKYLQHRKEKGNLDEFMTAEGLGGLPLENIVGVWDRQYSSEVPYFITLKQYYKLLKRKYPGRVPDPDEIVLDVSRVKRVDHEQEVRKVVRFEKVMEKLPSTVLEFLDFTESAYGKKIQNESDLDELVHFTVYFARALEEYNEEVQELRNVVQSEITEKDGVGKTQELKEFIGHFLNGSYYEKFTSIDKEIKLAGNKVMEGEISEGELKSIEGDIVKDLEQFPYLEFDLEDIEDICVRLVDLNSSKIGEQNLRAAIKSGLR